jgi:hypothetical protein
LKAIIATQELQSCSKKNFIAQGDLPKMLPLVHVYLLLLLLLLLLL